MMPDQRNFGDAIAALKSGLCMQRAGWNGKNMHIYLEKEAVFVVHGGAHKRTYDPCIVMYTAQGTHQPGWLASQADMLAEDWQEVRNNGRPA